MHKNGAICVRRQLSGGGGVAASHGTWHMRIPPQSFGRGPQQMKAGLSRCKQKGQGSSWSASNFLGRSYQENVWIRGLPLGLPPHQCGGYTILGGLSTNRPISRQTLPYGLR